MSQSAQTYQVDEELIAEVEAYMETLVTEDGTPVDNIFSEFQRRLLADTLQGSWRPMNENGSARSFLATTDVGVFWALRQPPLVPDMFLALDVELDINTPSDWLKKKNRSYFVWEHGKAPDVTVEIVSNREGNETGTKLRDYALIGVRYYIVFDPGYKLSDELVRIFQLTGGRYVAYPDNYLPEIGLGLTLWEGSYQNLPGAIWLRWCYQDGTLVSTGAERAAQEAERAALLAAKLRELGVDPDQILSK